MHRGSLRAAADRPQDPRDITECVTEPSCVEDDNLTDAVASKAAPPVGQ